MFGKLILQLPHLGIRQGVLFLVLFQLLFDFLDYFLPFLVGQGLGLVDLDDVSVLIDDLIRSLLDFIHVSIIKAFKFTFFT